MAKHLEMLEALLETQVSLENRSTSRQNFPRQRYYEGFLVWIRVEKNGKHGDKRQKQWVLLPIAH